MEPNVTHIPQHRHKVRRITKERLEKFISKDYFTDANLFGQLWSHTMPLTALLHFPAAGRISYQDAMKGDFTPSTIGDMFGPSWSTHWFKVKLLCAFRSICRSALTFRKNGQGSRCISSGMLVVKVLYGWTVSLCRAWPEEMAVISEKTLSWRPARTQVWYIFNFVSTCELRWQEGEHHELVLEVACNGMFGNDNGGIGPPAKDRYYQLKTCEVFVSLHCILGEWMRQIRTLNKTVWDLLWDFVVIADMAEV